MGGAKEFLKKFFEEREKEEIWEKYKDKDITKIVAYILKNDPGFGYQGEAAALFEISYDGWYCDYYLEEARSIIEEGTFYHWHNITDLEILIDILKQKAERVRIVLPRLSDIQSVIDMWQYFKDLKEKRKYFKEELKDIGIKRVKRERYKYIIERKDSVIEIIADRCDTMKSKPILWFTVKEEFNDGDYAALCVSPCNATLFRELQKLWKEFHYISLLF